MSDQTESGVIPGRIATQAAARCRATHPALVGAAALLLGGCASTAIDDNFASAQAFGRERLSAEVRWLTTDEARARARADVDAALDGPLTGDSAEAIALAYSPSLQALLYDRAAASAAATQSARLPNPVFAFERLVSSSAALQNVEITRSLAISLTDLLLLPARAELAEIRQRQVRLKLAGDVVATAIDARRAWVDAVAARQAVAYAQRVLEAADAAAELARRMQSAGNFSALQRAREQAFSAEAAVQLARSRRLALASREALVRVLGLDDAQASRLKLPETLPALPPAALDERALAQRALGDRIDLRLAIQDLESTARELGLTHVTSFVDGFEVAATDKRETVLPTRSGYELRLALPLFDFGDAGRARAEATYMAALHRAAQVGIDAGSKLRDAYGRYHAAYDVAQRYRDEIVPLRKAISDENLLRYNGMLIGVFELVADAREQVATVAQAMDAQRDFWLADAGLRAELIGLPGTGALSGDVAMRRATEAGNP
ncbi:MAG TPA: TolC family protein [Casimicrobiaceae bacterium]|nr:TolC family protein [Casimicrobiaceae bacterium]